MRKIFAGSARRRRLCWKGVEYLVARYVITMRSLRSALILRPPYTAFSTACISAKRLLVSMEKCLKSVIDDCGQSRPRYLLWERLAMEWETARTHQVRADMLLGDQVEREYTEYRDVSMHRCRGNHSPPQSDMQR
jgi:hypothetical protein